jgi:hypothetical protein
MRSQQSFMEGLENITNWSILDCTVELSIMFIYGSTDSNHHITVIHERHVCNIFEQLVGRTSMTFKENDHNTHVLNGHKGINDEKQKDVNGPK